MPAPSSRFQRTAYANRASSLSRELADWSKIYGMRSYAIAYTPAEVRAKGRLDEHSVVLADLAMQLERIAITIRSLA